jgi:ubiquitin-protein ligase
MFTFFKSKKKNPIPEINKKDLEKEIESLENFKEGIYIKYKDNGNEYLIDIMIEKNIIGIDSEKAKERVPKIVAFLIIIVQGYPVVAPKILTKSNFCTPSLMDGRDLLKDICPNWTPKSNIKSILEGILPFLSRVINAKGYKFYGMFHLGATYNLKNFDNMIVVTFYCNIEENDNKSLFIKSLNTKADYELILTEDCFLLLEKLDTGNGKIVFWSSLFAITDLQLNKCNKITSINFYDEESNSEFQLKLKVDNILLFRDSLVKKMKALKVKLESQKLIKGQKPINKRLTEKEIKAMKINDIEKNTNDLKERISKGEITDYTVNTFTTLCGKAIEHYSMLGDNKYMQYVEMMKNILNMEKVNKLTIDDEKEIKENAEKP